MNEKVKREKLILKIKRNKGKKNSGEERQEIYVKSNR